MAKLVIKQQEAKQEAKLVANQRAKQTEDKQTGINTMIQFVWCRQCLLNAERLSYFIVRMLGQ